MEEAIEIETHELRPFAGVEPKYDLQPNHGSFLSTASITCAISYSISAKIWLYMFLMITSVPFVVGAAFTSIFIGDGNYNAAVFAFLTGCLSLGTISLFILHLLRKIEKAHDSSTLEGLKVLGMMTSVSSGISLGVYTILAFFKKQSFSIYGENFFSSSVFSGICLATSIQLYLTAQWYQNALKESERVAKLEKFQTINSISSVIN